MTRLRATAPLDHWPCLELGAGHVMTLHGPKRDAVTVAVAVSVPVASVPNLIKLAEKCSGMELFVRPARGRNSLR